MAYLNLPPVPPPPPAGYVARAPAPARPPQLQVEAKAPPASGSSHGPAVILGGALAKPAPRVTRQEPDPPKPPAHHVDRVI
ncbi:hypothetical protein [Phenylobacterium sp.]|uniref:hypothetical protein n=1 Tax=Phenylobacterium sp. TaxID=1871053 RepID=UPI0035615D6E